MTSPRRHVVVGIDGSESARDAARWASVEAASQGASVRLVHAMIPQKPDPVFDAPDIRRDYGADALDAARRAISNGVSPDEARVESVLVTGDPVDSILHEAAGAAMIVVGASAASRMGAIASRLFGSTDLSLIERATCPVVVVPNLPADVSGPVLVCVEDDDNEFGPITEARGLALAQTVPVFPVPIRKLLHEMGHRTEGARAAVREAIGSGVLRGVALPESEYLSATAQIVVIGHDGGRAPGQAVLSLVRHSRCPVMVVPR